MEKLSVISGAEVVSALERDGWFVNRESGIHVILLKKGNNASLSVPMYRDLVPGTVQALIQAAGLTIDEFVGLLKK